MKKSKIKLPVNDDLEIDFKFIENFIKKLDIKKSIFKNYKLSLIKEKINLNDKEFKYFNINELFEVTGSKTTKKDILEEYGEGEFPYITTQATNNGVKGFYDFFTEKGGVLTIDSAVVGFCSYQEKDFSASDHVEKLVPQFKLNKYIAKFLTTIINKEN
ncbi:MAG: restriction endonuclease subunit S [Candidatus Gracilibacteria bacterium]|nr:restriction endonuclease subunit S [Candidatus Gracilibacteria bacterium]MDQ7022663.1 restriction endonuclease subunit S [Candidatus Gracilibacteria bacterium]